MYVLYTLYAVYVVFYQSQNQNQKSFNVPQTGNFFVTAVSEYYKNRAIAKGPKDLSFLSRYSLL